MKTLCSIQLINVLNLHNTSTLIVYTGFMLELLE